MEYFDARHRILIGSLVKFTKEINIINGHMPIWNISMPTALPERLSSRRLVHRPGLGTVADFVAPFESLSYSR